MFLMFSLLAGVMITSYIFFTKSGRNYVEEAKLKSTSPSSWRSFLRMKKPEVTLFALLKYTPYDYDNSSTNIRKNFMMGKAAQWISLMIRLANKILSSTSYSNLVSLDHL